MDLAIDVVLGGRSNVYRLLSTPDDGVDASVTKASVNDRLLTHERVRVVWAIVLEWAGFSSPACLHQLTTAALRCLLAGAAHIPLLRPQVADRPGAFPAVVCQHMLCCGWVRRQHRVVCGVGWCCVPWHTVPG